MSRARCLLAAAHETGKDTHDGSRVHAPESAHVRARERAQVDGRLAAVDIPILLPVSLGPDHFVVRVARTLE